MTSVMSVTIRRNTHEIVKKVVLENAEKYRLCGQFINIVDALAIATEKKPDIIIIRSQMVFIGLEEFIRSLTARGIYCAYIVLDTGTKSARNKNLERNEQIVACLDENELTEERTLELLENALPSLMDHTARVSAGWMPYDESDELSSWFRENQFFGAVINHQIAFPLSEHLPSFLRCTRGFLIMLELHLPNEHNSFSLWQNMWLLKKLIVACQIQLGKFEGFHFFCLQDKKLCFWIDASCDLDDLLPEISQLRDNLYNIFADSTVVSITAYCGEQPVTLDDLGQEYRDIDNLRKYHFFVDDRVVLYSNWLKIHSITPNNDSIQYCFEQLSESLQTINRNAYCSCIDFLFSFIEQSLSFQTYYYIWNQLISWYCVIYERLGLSYTNGVINVNQNNYPTLDAAKADFRHQLIILFDEAALRTVPTSNQYVVQALSFCDTHVSENFSLEDMAKSIGLSPSYLSHLLHKELGHSFVEVKTAKKITQAKVLLENHKVYEVAQLLGFHDVKYFSRIFKRVIGTSPAGYQKSLKYRKNESEGGQN